MPWLFLFILNAYNVILSQLIYEFFLNIGLLMQHLILSENGKL